MHTYNGTQLIQIAKNALFKLDNETTLISVGSTLLNSKIEYLGSSVYETESGELFVDLELEDSLSAKLESLADQSLLVKTFNAIAHALNLPLISHKGADQYEFIIA